MAFKRHRETSRASPRKVIFDTLQKLMPADSIPALPAYSDLVKQRRSIRRFQHRAFPLELLSEVMEEVRFVPTPTNRQCYRFLGVQNPLLIERMRLEILTRTEEIAGRLDEKSGQSFREYSQWFTFFDNAPVVLVGLFRLFSSRLPVGDPGQPPLEGVAELQAFGGAVQTLLLSLQARGLGSCWMSGPLIAEERLLRLLHIEKPWRLGAIIPVGLPDQPAACPKKPQVSEIFGWHSQ